MSNRTLFTITDDLIALETLLSEVDGDVSDAEVETAIDAWFAEIETDLDAKLDGYAYLIAEFDARQEWRKREAARLTALAKTDENNVSRLKNSLKLFFERTKRPKHETDRFKFSVQKNGGKVPILFAEDVPPPEQLPLHLQKITVSLDGEALRRDLEENQTAVEWARLGERGTHVRIK